MESSTAAPAHPVMRLRGSGAGGRRQGPLGGSSCAAVLAAVLVLCQIALQGAYSAGEEGSSVAHLVTGTWNHLNNQRLSVLRGIVTAQELGYVFVLPTWQLNYADFPPYGTATLVPFSYFYSVEVFEQWAAANNLRVAREVPPHLLPACFAMLQHSFTTSLSVRIRPDNGEKQVFIYDGSCPSVPDLKAAMADWAESYGVICLTAKCTFAIQDPANNGKLLPIRPALVPSPAFASEADAVVAELQKVYGASRYVAVHARTEADWRADCPERQADFAFGFTCYVDEAEITNYLLAGQEAEGALVFIASADPISAFPTLCAKFKCWKRESIKPQLAEGIYNKRTSVAFLDLLLAMRSTTFYGNQFSAFTQEVAEELRARNSTTDVRYYNPPSW